MYTVKSSACFRKYVFVPHKESTVWVEMFTLVEDKIFLIDWTRRDLTRVKQKRAYTLKILFTWTHEVGYPEPARQYSIPQSVQSGTVER